MLKIGLTGSIGTGKSETLRLFASKGVAVFDADKVVHELYAKGGGAVEAISRQFPGAVTNDGVDRTKLSKIVLASTKRIKALEDIVHPLVRRARQDIVRKAKQDGAAMIVLDIPLLFETADPDDFDFIIVVSAPAPIQRKRVLERPGMSEQKLAAILAKQTPDAEKRAKADFVIETSHGLKDASRQIDVIIARLGSAQSS